MAAMPRPAPPGTGAPAIGAPGNGNGPRGLSGARAAIRLTGTLPGHQQQVIGLPGSLGRPPLPRLSRGEILKAVCQETQRLSERRDTVLENEHTLVQGRP